jgi:hypothetical protein
LFLGWDKSRSNRREEATLRAGHVLFCTLPPLGGLTTIAPQFISPPWGRAKTPSLSCRRSLMYGVLCTPQSEIHFKHGILSHPLQVCLLEVHSFR